MMYAQIQKEPPPPMAPAGRRETSKNRASDHNSKGGRTVWSERWRAGLRRSLKVGALVALLVGAGLAYQFWWGGGGGHGLQIETVTVARSDVRRTVTTSGAVRAVVTVDVGSQLSGQISEINADFSDEVAAGDVLARIDPSTFETRVREAEAAVAIARANVALQEATVKRDRAQLEKAEIDLERTSGLAARGTASQIQLEAARMAHTSAEADLAIAEAQLETALATLDQREAALHSARIDLERTVIRSPIDGLVIERAIEVGQTVAASMAAPVLFQIAQDLTQVQINAQVDEADIGQIRIGNHVTFKVDAYPDQPFDGVVAQIRLAPVERDNVVTYTVVIRAENPRGEMLPGMTASLEIVTGVREDVLALPNQALRFRPRGSAQALVLNDPVASRGAPEESPRGASGSDQADAESDLTVELRGARNASEAALSEPREASDPSSPPQGQPLLGTTVEKTDRQVAPSIFLQDQSPDVAGEAPPRQALVWTLERGMLVAHEVTLGMADVHVTEILDGLEDGARVVVRVRERGD
jgi:HlyD family secretion protein